MKLSLGFCLLMLWGTLTMTPARAADSPPSIYAFFGTYTGGGKSEGIYCSTLDASGRLSPPRLVGKAKNPSFLAIHPSHRYLYAVGEISDFQGKPTGGVSAFALDLGSGNLRLLNQQSSQGAGPCHLVVDATGKNVLVANYGGGSVACLPIGDDGRLGEATAAIQHQGSSVDPARQKGPHAHSVNLDPANRLAIVADLGLDKLMLYRFDAQRHTLETGDPAFVALPPGGGPRHFAFHPNGRFAYANNEMLSTVSSLAFDADRGSFEVLETISTLPPGGHEGNSTAETRVHPSGRFVYVSNRGHDSIAIFGVDAETGKLTPAGHQSTLGAVPRNFNIAPGGKLMLVANQDSHNVVPFAIDQGNGQLQPVAAPVEVGSPVCVRFVALDELSLGSDHLQALPRKPGD